MPAVGRECGGLVVGLGYWSLAMLHLQKPILHALTCASYVHVCISDAWCYSVSILSDISHRTSGGLLKGLAWCICVPGESEILSKLNRFQILFVYELFAIRLNVCLAAYCAGLLIFVH